MKQISTFAFLTGTAAAILAAAPAVATAALSQQATAASTSAAASIYNLYVTPNGSDANTGTQASPFRTLNKAASVAKPGTTVHVAPGTYIGNVSTQASGTAANHIRYLADTKWGARIIGTGSESMWTNNGSYVDIDGFDVSGSGRLGIANYGSYTVVSNNHVHNLTISGGCSGSGGAGIVNANYSSTSGDMIGNVVNDIGTPGACNGIQGLYSSNSGSKIMNNTVYRVSAYGIHLWHAASNTIIANNTVYGNGSSSMGGGIVTGVGDAPGGVKLTNTQVVNNTVYNNPGSGITQYCYSGLSCIGAGNVVANNVVYGNG